MYNRKQFIKQSIGAGLALGLSTTPLSLFAKKDKSIRLTILHTNDWHSKIEPFPMDGNTWQGMGGASRRAALIKKIRSENTQVLLLDCGDICQGSPYFNFFKGEVEMKLMNEMKYDFATLGNHEFDNGLSDLDEMLALADFKFLNANYDFTNTQMKYKFEPYQIIEKGKLKIGIIGIGSDLKENTPQQYTKNIIFKDPIETINNTVSLIREECDYIIVLSHLGHDYTDDKISDIILAKNTAGIDMILGAKTHTFLNEPIIVKNKIEKEVIINQVGWGGIFLGKINLVFEKNKVVSTNFNNLKIEG